MLECNTIKEERELDARVAEAVFGHEIEWDGSNPVIAGKDKRAGNPVPHYCTNIGASFMVALELRRQGHVVDIHLDSSGISLRVCDAQGNELIEHRNIISQFANHMCHAALVAVGAERRLGGDRRKARY